MASRRTRDMNGGGAGTADGHGWWTMDGGRDSIGVIMDGYGSGTANVDGCGALDGGSLEATDSYGGGAILGEGWDTTSSEGWWATVGYSTGTAVGTHDWKL